MQFSHRHPSVILPTESSTRCDFEIVIEQRLVVDKLREMSERFSVSSLSYAPLYFRLMYTTDVRQNFISK